MQHSISQNITMLLPSSVAQAHQTAEIPTESV